ncbi:MAG: efflux RND transporter periplasmic adaptor subunit [Planctomycetaceae bacterium]|nr:efflux RND transporter periplasmic adaptor subunit [Planctomycetaceae bacterium]
MSDFRTYELRQLRPRLREEVSFTWQSYGGAECYVLEDASRGAFFRIGLPEYTFLSLLDGRTTIGDAITQTVNVLGREAFDEQQAGVICHWLVESKLLAPDGPRDQNGQADQAEATKLARRLNPLSMRLPLGCPQPMLEALDSVAGGLFSLGGLLVWLTIMACAAWQLAPHTEQLWRESAVILSPHNWWWIALWGLGLKVVHETSHGLACVRFGGRVRDAGIVFVLLAPVPYVDLTSTWRLPKWRRIVTSAAGMFAELLIAAVAAILWANSNDELLRQHLLQLMLTASVVTLLFNANPLMRFDGYYILADWLELPNLAVHGQQWLIHLVKRWLLGVSSTSPTWPEGRTWLVAAYGVTSAMWRLVVSVSLIVAAAVWFEGAGIVLAAGAVLAWFVHPLWRGLRYVLVGTAFERPSRTRFVAIATCLAASLTWLLTSVTAWHSIALPGVVESVDAATVRAESSGFVEEVLVESGQTVSAGDPLIRLSNHELESQRRQLVIEIERSVLRSRTFQQAGELAARNAEDDNRAGLETQLEELDDLCEQLLIRAPLAGVVAASDLLSLVGSYVAPGRELLVIGDAEEKEVRVLISPEQFEAASLSLDHVVRVRLTDDGFAAAGSLHKIEPRATVHAPHPALCAGAGGPIVTKVSASHSAQRSRDSQELLEPHVIGYVSLDRATSRLLGPGQLATVSIAEAPRPLGCWLLERSERWLTAHHEIWTGKHNQQLLAKRPAPFREFDVAERPVLPSSETTIRR